MTRYPSSSQQANDSEFLDYMNAKNIFSRIIQYILYNVIQTSSVFDYPKAASLTDGDITYTYEYYQHI